MTYNHLIIRLSFLLLLLLPCYHSVAQSSVSVNDIPNPKVAGNGSVSDVAGILDPAETDSLNSMLTRMEQKTGVETAVVIVNDFDVNEEEFGFAVKLFRKWGIGKKHANNGLLLFIAIDRRQYRFITGYGLEGLLPDADLKIIGEHYLVPAFKEQNYGDGILATFNVITTYLKNPGNSKELAALLAKDSITLERWYMPGGIIILLIVTFILVIRYLKKRTPAITKTAEKKASSYQTVAAGIAVAIFIIAFAGAFILAFTIGFKWIKGIKPEAVPVIVYVFLAVAVLLRYMNVLGVIRKAHTDDENYAASIRSFMRLSWWNIVFSPLILVVIVVEFLRQQKYAKRFTPPLDDKGQPMTRVDRDKNVSGSPYLSAGQHTEETINVYCYDIWLIGGNVQLFKIIQHPGSSFSSHDFCPQCGFKTLKKPETKTLVKPSYTRQGEGKKIRQCVQCKFEELIGMVTIPMLVRNKDSSSSGSGSSSSSSSSSSYGGGSTGGGGAGGNW